MSLEDPLLGFCSLCSSLLGAGWLSSSCRRGYAWESSLPAYKRSFIVRSLLWPALWGLRSGTFVPVAFYSPQSPLTLETQAHLHLRAATHSWPAPSMKPQPLTINPSAPKSGSHVWVLLPSKTTTYFFLYLSSFQLLSPDCWPIQIFIDSLSLPWLPELTCWITE